MLGAFKFKGCAEGGVTGCVANGDIRLDGAVVGDGDTAAPKPWNCADAGAKSNFGGLGVPTGKERGLEKPPNEA